MLDLEKRCRQLGLATADLEDMAYVCYEANRAWQRSRGVFRLVAWPEADMAMRDDARHLVLVILEGDQFDLDEKAAIFRALALALVRLPHVRIRTGDPVPG